MPAPTTPSPTEVTYGELVASSQAWIDLASRRDCGPYPDPDSAHQAVDGYQRLLATAGRHLRIFVEPGFPHPLARTPSDDAVIELEHRWSRLYLPSATDTDWSRAADQLGAAHDLLCTHIGAYGQALSPDADELLAPEVKRAASHRMLEQLAPAVTACGRVLDNARAAHRRSHPGPTKAQISALRALEPRMEHLLTDASRDYTTVGQAAGSRSSTGSDSPATTSPAPADRSTSNHRSSHCGSSGRFPSNRPTEPNTSASQHCTT